jgi:hypothetical protein
VPRRANAEDADFAFEVLKETMRAHVIATWGAWHEEESRRQAIEDGSGANGGHRVGWRAGRNSTGGAYARACSCGKCISGRNFSGVESGRSWSNGS